jgi:hypothetical protein
MRRNGIRPLPAMLLALLLFTTAAGRARAETVKGGMGYFLGGTGFVIESGDGAVIGSTGGGGHSLTNNWILGGEGHSVFGPDNAGGYGFLNIGYTILVSRNLLVYPLLGFGGGALTRESDSTVSTCALLNPAAGIDYLIYTGAGGGILVGLRTGCVFTVYSDAWHWAQPYARLAIGGFGFGE